MESGAYLTMHETKLDMVDSNTATFKNSIRLNCFKFTVFFTKKGMKDVKYSSKDDDECVPRARTRTEIWCISVSSAKMTTKSSYPESGYTHT